MADQIPPGAPPPGQSPVPPNLPPNPPPAGATLVDMTPERIKETYAKSPEMFKDIMPPPPPPENLELKLPEGTNVDPKVLDRFREKWKSTPPGERAQATVDFYLELQSEAVQSNVAKFNNWKTANETTLKADPDFKDFDAALSMAGKPLDKFGSDLKIREELKVMGLDRHPGLTKLFHRIGKAMSEDSTRRPAVISQESNEQQEQLYQRYPSMRPKSVES